MPLAGTCKDCGNGTLNNDLAPAFRVFAEVDSDGFENGYYDVQCLRCGSGHVDVVA